MKNSDLKTCFEEAAFFPKKTRVEKIAKIPLKLFCSKILEIFAQKFNKPIQIRTKTFWGEEMDIVIPETVSLNLFRYGFFEEGLTRMILEYLKPGMTFFDIGAHFGYYTLLGSSLIGKKGQVHSFEPTPSTFDILKTNVSNKNNVIVNKFAVFSRKTKIFMNDYGIKYSAFNSIYNPRLPNNIISKLNLQQYQIETISIDEYVENKGIKPDFIKIDAENAEYEILVGMKKTINSYHPIITIEVGDEGIDGIPKSSEVISFLLQKGYKAYEFKDGNIQEHNLKDEYRYDNILFLSK